VDTAWFSEAGLEPPTDLQSLTDPAYRDLLVVENPASSSPGLAFLLATVVEFGDDWEGYWEDLVDNGVSVVDDWSAAYYESFSMAGGDRPLAVSYGSSPPFEMIYATEPIDAPTTTALADTCFRQVEFAGVLAGTDAPAEARQLVDFLLTPAFQETIALNLFMFPVDPDVELAPELAEFSVVPDDPLTLDPSDIAEHRDEWIETWTDTVLR
jgi:thiamine transport system substrate-binding protein